MIWLTDSKGQQILVNSDLITLISTHLRGSRIYFDGDDSIDVRQNLTEILSKINDSRTVTEAHDGSTRLDLSL